jgi:Arc/MetJ family transcription regulator
MRDLKSSMLVTYVLLYMTNKLGWWLMSVTQVDIDDDALERAMALSGAKTKKEAVNLALQFYADKQERAARIAQHFERARHWGALEDAERLHRAEKEIR